MMGPTQEAQCRPWELRDVGQCWMREQSSMVPIWVPGEELMEGTLTNTNLAGLRIS